MTDRDSNSFYVVLGLLGSGAKSGYDIKKTIEQQIGSYYKISNGQIYPALKKLLLLEYATLTVERNDGKPDRKVYLITDKGRAAFLDWLIKPADYFNPSGNELLLKLFFGAQAEIEQNINLIAAYMELKSGALQTYNKIAEIFNPSKIRSLEGHYGYLTLRYGQILAEAGIQWCKEAIAYIKRLEDEQ